MVQVVAQLQKDILPQAKDLLNKANREAGTTVPTSFVEVKPASAWPA